MNGIDAGAVLQTHIRHPYLLGIFALLVIASLMVAVMHAPRIERRIMPISVVSLLVFAFLLVVLSLVGIYRSVLVDGQHRVDAPVELGGRVTSTFSTLHLHSNDVPAPTTEPYLARQASAS